MAELGFELPQSVVENGRDSDPLCVWSWGWGLAAGGGESSRYKKFGILVTHYYFDMNGV